MKRKWPILLTGGVLLLVTLALAIHFSAQKPLWGCVARIKLEKILVGDEAYEPDWLQQQSQIIHNFFDAPETRKSIGESLGIGPTSFSLTGFRPVRCTSLVELRFGAETSNEVWRVTEIAGSELADYYSTNQPKVLLECVDMGYSFPPGPWWKHALGKRDDFSDVSTWR